MLTALYRGTVARNDDPEGLQRLQVTVPQVFGDQVTDWAWPQVPPGSRLVPQPGETVWIQFEAGDPDRPVWQGVWHTLGGAPGSFSVPLQLYVGLPAPAVLPPYPGITMPTTAVQETSPGTTTVNATTFVTTGGTSSGGPLSAPSAAISGNASVGGQATLGSAAVTGAATVGGTFGVTGATTVGGTLGVTGKSTLGVLQAGSSTLGATTINGNTTVNGTLTATSIVGTIQLDTTAADISVSNPGSTKLAGGTGLAADAGHRHGREDWGLVADISTSQPGDAAAVGAAGRVADAGHKHRRNLQESIFIGTANGVGPAGTGIAHQNDGWVDLNPPALVSATKIFGSTDFIIAWAVGGYVGGVGQGFISPGGAIVWRLKLVKGATTNFSAQYPLFYNVAQVHMAVGSFLTQVTGLAAGTWTITLQVYANNMTLAGADWRWDNNDAWSFHVTEA